MDSCPHLCLNAACSLGSMSSLLLAFWLILFFFLPLSSFKAYFLHEASLTTPVFVGLCPLSSQALTLCTVPQVAMPLKSWPLLLKGLAVPVGACGPHLSHMPLGHIFRADIFLWIQSWKKCIFEDYLTCLLRNQYSGQEATVRTGHGTTDNWERNTSRLYIVTLLI